MQCPHCLREVNTSGACPYCGYDAAGDAEKYPLALRPGSVLNGRYILGHVLGQGGFGITYLAWDENMKERVAIKEYLPGDFANRSTGSSSVQVYSGGRAENFAYGKAQFLEEAKTLAAFNGDSHIVRVYSYFEENGTAYFCMEYVDGLPLDKYMAAKGGRLSPDEADRLLLPLMESLEKVHAKGIVHRDIAPDNILVTADGTAKLIDFGAARYSTGEKSKSLDIILKHGFAPKEQYMRRARQGPWTDVYAMAATYYYAVTGKVPPEAIERIDEDDLIPPSSLGVKLSDAQEDALFKALAVSAAERFQSMGEFRRAMLGTTGAESTAAAPVGKTTFVSEAPAAPAAKPEPVKKKSKRPLILGAVAVVAAVIFGVTRLTGGGESAAVKETVAPVESSTPTPDPQEAAYAEAEAYLQEGVPHKAWSAFHALGDYKDAQDRANEIAHDMRVKNCKAIAAGGSHTVGQKSDGTVVSAGSNLSGQRNISDWADIVSVSAGGSHTVGLKADGTVVTAGSNLYGQCEVSNWTDIVAIESGGSYTVGLKADGTVVATEYTGNKQWYHGQCDVSGWTDIVSIEASGYHTMGIKADGTVVAVGSNEFGECDVSDWREIIAVAGGNFGVSSMITGDTNYFGHTLGLKKDGTVVLLGKCYFSKLDVSDWQDIVAIASSARHVAGLRTDGTVVAKGSNSDYQCAVSGWKNIVAIAAGGSCTLGLQADGRVVAAGGGEYSECNVSGWRDIAPAK